MKKTYGGAHVAKSMSGIDWDRLQVLAGFDPGLIPGAVTLTITVPDHVEDDPVFEQTPETWRGAWGWLKRCVAYSWREATGARAVTPGFTIVVDDVALDFSAAIKSIDQGYEEINFSYTHTDCIQMMSHDHQIKGRNWVPDAQEETD